MTCLGIGNILSRWKRFLKSKWQNNLRQWLYGEIFIHTQCVQFLSVKKMFVGLRYWINWNSIKNTVYFKLTRSCGHWWSSWPILPLINKIKIVNDIRLELSSHPRQRHWLTIESDYEMSALIIVLPKKFCQKAFGRICQIGVAKGWVFKVRFSMWTSSLSDQFSWNRVWHLGSRRGRCDCNLLQSKERRMAKPVIQVDRRIRL